MERRRKYSGYQPTENPKLCIKIFNRQSHLPVKISSIRKFVLYVLKKKRVSFQEVSVYLVGKKRMSALHEKFFKDPTPTDCLSFPLEQPFLGDIFVSPQVAIEYNPTAPYQETMLYILHGLLHLLGYIDTNKKDRDKMRKEEDRLIRLATIQQCILESPL